MKQDRRPSIGARRFGYALTVGINVAILYAIHGWPGWESADILTDATTQVLGLVTVSLVVGIAVNVVYLVLDPPRVRAIGEFLTAAIGLVVLIRIWQVFPFDFSGYSFNWAVLVRILLILGIVGSAIALLVNVVAFVRARPGS